MKDLEYIKALTDIDESFVQEALSVNDSTTKRRFSKRFVAIAVAAAILVLIATGWIYASNISAQFKISKSISLPDSIANEVPIPVLTPNSTNAEYGGYEHLLTRLPIIAEQYGVTYEEVSHYRLKNDGEYFIETGAFFTDDEAFAFFFTSDSVLETENHVYVVLYNEQKNEYKYEHRSFINTGSYTVSVKAEHGWSIIGAGSYFFSETTSTGSGKIKDLDDQEKELEIAVMISEEYMRYEYEYRKSHGMEIYFDMS